ncbi:MAG: hypothetical protein GXX84_18825, partial [Acidobacteria bacterium]|nr:hypothetical protein [Acidobacteriota bacterium]
IHATGPADALCPPQNIRTSLVGREGELSSKEEIQKVFSKCMASIVEGSTNRSRQSDYTHISGAVSMAVDSTRGDYDERFLIILSDFEEDLPTGGRTATMKLSNEKVIMLHRPKWGEPPDVGEYLDRIEWWQKRFMESGAEEVKTIPLFSISEQRFRDIILKPRPEWLRTSLTILADFKPHIFPSGGNGLADSGEFVRIGRVVAAMADEWPNAVTVQWIGVNGSGFQLRAERPVDYGRKLVKSADDLDLITDESEFLIAMEELARRFSVQGRGVYGTDLSGTLRLLSSVNPIPRLNILMIVSDFHETIPRPVKFRFPDSERTHTYVVMFHKPSPEDARDPDRYWERLDRWERDFMNGGARRVCRLPLMSWTPSDLQSCLPRGD